MTEEIANGSGATPALPLHDRVAIITGASRGIGRAVALHLSSLGAKLILNYVVNSTQANLLADEINGTSDSSDGQHKRAIAVQADISDPTQVKALFDFAEQSFSTKPHILVNCAGVLDSKFPEIATTTDEDWDTIFNINARGAFFCFREAARRLVRGGGGRIIALSSSLVAALRPKFAAYTASKAAVEVMIKIMSRELNGTGITANCVAPGPVATEMFFAGKTEEMVQRSINECPLGRLGETGDIAPVVGFLASDAGQWVNGQVIRVNGGYI